MLTQMLCFLFPITHKAYIVYVDFKMMNKRC